MIKFSIVIPLYNAESYIIRCFESILRQNYENLEVIFVNDGSTDNSQSIIEKISNNNNVKFINQGNSGPGIARNIGILNAIGENILFLDVDDELENDALNGLDNFLLDKIYDVVCFGFNLRGSNSQIIKSITFHEKTSIKDNIKDFFEIGTIKNVIWNKLYKRKFLLENNIKFDDSRINEDALFVFKIILNTNSLIFYNKIVYNHISDNNLSYTNMPSVFHFENTLNVIRTISNNLNENNLLEKYKNSFNVYIIRMLSYILFLTSLKISDREKFINTSAVIYDSEEWNRVKHLINIPLKNLIIKLIVKYKYILWGISSTLKKFKFSIQ
jgi:glycosyltransferase involved in cell wall biosynthesis